VVLGVVSLLEDEERRTEQMPTIRLAHLIPVEMALYDTAIRDYQDAMIYGNEIGMGRLYIDHLMGMTDTKDMIIPRAQG
jgi:hypothetical protein